MRKNFFLLSKPSVLTLTVLVLWFCLAVDVLTFMPKRAVYSLTRARLSADEKLFELWGGLFSVSEHLKSEKLLGVTVGVPAQSEAARLGLKAPYGLFNYRALGYPGRMVEIQTADELINLKPEFLVLDKSWPEFTFTGDPRSPENRFVNEPQLVKISTLALSPPRKRGPSKLDSRFRGNDRSG